MSRLDMTLAAIARADASHIPAVRAHLNDLTKPPESLGLLEDLAVRYCLATGTTTPAIGRKRIVTFAGDHGVTAEGVSAYPAEVTPQMVMNMVAGGAAINVLASHAGADVRVVDVGVNAELGEPEGLVARKVRMGTANIAEGPAMTVDEARQALEVGIELADEAAEDGVTLLGTGDMGIGNTTPSTALAAALLPCDPAPITGPGTGIDDETIAHKTAVIRRALEVNAKALADPLTALAAVGGLEIAGICGMIIGGAAHRMLVVVDGFISSAAALVAVRMNEAVLDYALFSHFSAEWGHATLLDRMGVSAPLDLQMRLGEGTGAALAMTLVEASVRIYNEMATFSSAGVSDRE